MDFEEAFLDERDFSNCWDIVDGVCGTLRVVAVDFRTVGIAFHLMFLTYAFTVPSARRLVTPGGGPTTPSTGSRNSDDQSTRDELIETTDE